MAPQRLRHKDRKHITEISIQSYDAESIMTIPSRGTECSRKKRIDNNLPGIAILKLGPRG